jgi:hypothetical protein
MTQSLKILPLQETSQEGSIGGNALDATARMFSKQSDLWGVLVLLVKLEILETSSPCKDL